MVVREGGRRCPCGRRGCLEAYAGRAAMEARARRLHDRGAKTKLFELAAEHDRDRLTSGIWERALEHRDKLATKLIDRAVEALGAGIASAVNLLDVEAVVIGGGLGVRFGEPYRARIVAAMLPHLFNDARPPAVHVAALGDLGGALGATLLVEPMTDGAATGTREPRHRKRRCRARPTARHERARTRRCRATSAAGRSRRRPTAAARRPRTQPPPHRTRGFLWFVAGAARGQLLLSVLLQRGPRSQPRVTIPFSPYFIQRSTPARSARSRPRATPSRASSRPR